MPVFLQGRRAFLSSLRRRHRRCNPLSVHRVTNSGLAYPRRAYSCFTYSCRACPAAAAACHSYSHLASPTAADFGYRSAARHAPLPLGPNSRTIRAPSPILPKAPPRPASLLLFCPGPPSRRPRHKKRRTEPHRGPSAAKKQPICRGSITAAALQPVRSVHCLKQTRSV